MKILHLIAILLVIQTFNANAQSQSTKNKQKLYVVGHAHMDPVYRWRWNEIKYRELDKTFSDVLLMLDDYPDLQFAQSSLLFYETIQKHFPNLFNEVKASIADKRWSVVGGQWVETDETMPSGESLIRQFLVSKDYYSKNLDIESISIAWSPDVFTGHPVTLPKIYAGCGIQNFVFSRDAPANKKIFWWESKDGSRVLAYKIPGHYNPTFRDLPDRIEEWVETSGYELPMITFGKGDHGGGPGEGDMRALTNLSQRFNLEIEHISPEEYFKNLNKVNQKWPVQDREFGYQDKARWKGCYTSQAGIKKLNRYYENKLIAAEKWLAIGTMHKGKPFYPREDFLEAWKLLLFNQFHDIIPGTLTGLAANDVYKDYDRLEEISTELLNAGLENIGNRINTEIDGIPLVIYNPHSWPVSQLVQAEVKFVKEPGEFDLRNSQGKSIPYSVLNQSDDQTTFRIHFNATDISPLGYSVVQVVEEKPNEIKSDLILGNNQIENSQLIVKWDDEGLTSLFSKTANKEMLKETANRLRMLEDNGNSWSFKLTGKEFPMMLISEPEIVFESPLKIVVRWEDYYQSSKITRYMTVKSNSRELDFEMEVDWQSHNKLLQVGFPTSIAGGKACYDQPYGYVEREEADHEYPAQKWVDYSNGDLGIALINNGKYGFSIHDGSLSMSIVRGARDMDPRMDEGIHSFKYSILVHEGDWRKADIPLRAWEFNQPLITKQENHHPGEITGWKFSDQSFPLEKSFFKIDSDHVIISSLKTQQDAYNPNPIILRIVETEGRDAETTVHLPYHASSVVESNHLEERIDPRSEIKVEDKQFSFQIGHNQIRTFMVYF